MIDLSASPLALPAANGLTSKVKLPSVLVEAFSPEFMEVDCALPPISVVSTRGVTLSTTALLLLEVVFFSLGESAVQLRAAAESCLSPPITSELPSTAKETKSFQNSFVHEKGLLFLNVTNISNCHLDFFMQFAAVYHYIGLNPDIAHFAHFYLHYPPLSTLTPFPTKRHSTISKHNIGSKSFSSSFLLLQIFSVS